MSFDLKIIDGDLKLINGQLQQVIDSEKLIQNILKICLTTAGSNPLFPWYGSLLSKAIIGNPLSNDIILEISKTQLSTALENLKSLQNLQVKSMQRVSADEQMSAILNISVSKSLADPRVYNVEISVLSKGFKPITTAFKISTI